MLGWGSVPDARLGWVSKIGLILCQFLKFRDPQNGRFRALNSALAQTHIIGTMMLARLTTVQATVARMNFSLPWSGPRQS